VAPIKTIKNIINIVLIILISTIFFCCKNDIEEVNKLTVSNDRPSFQVIDLETSFSDSGQVKVKIYAPELVRYERGELQYDEYPEGVNVEFYNSVMEVTGTLRCNYARYLIKEERWEAKSDVEVNNMKKELIYSDKFVRITTAEEILFGEGFESNQDFSKWKILKPTGTINVKDE
jgi:lipopolysaccharide export system protein LptC